MDELAIRVREALDCTLDAVLRAGEVEEGEDFPELSVVENRLERLRKERDNMGPVNLRAELEANEVEEKLTSLQTEQTDEDVRFILLWIGFNAAYAGDVEASRVIDRKSTRLNSSH